MKFPKSALYLSGLVLALVLSGCSSGAGNVLPTPTPTCDDKPDVAISAYDLWIEEGNSGTVKDFLDSLVGEKGKDGYVGYRVLESTDGEAGASAYQLWLGQGNTGTPQEFLDSLGGAAGAEGLSAYDLWLEQGNTGTKDDFLESLRGVPGIDGVCTIGDAGPQGPAGPQGVQGAQGIQGPVGPAGPILSPSEVSYVMGGGTTGAGAQAPTFDGNPQFYGSYVVMGDLVYFNVKVVMTNITYFGRGQYYVTLPFASKHPISTSAGRVTDFSSGRNYSLNGSAQAGSSQLLLTYDSGAQQVPFDYNSPVSLTTTDTFFISGTYIRQ